MTDRVDPHDRPDVLGVRASLPAPGWTVVDAARDQRFTGEVVARTDHDDEFRIYLDRGDVYCAERATDPSLGRRLVDAGALNDAQLDYGTLRIGEIEHLGRLFDRVPSINRDAVFVLNQLMTEETVRSAAARAIVDVQATPYRHHPSGMHRWSSSDPSGSAPPWGELPELALPAPAPGARPVVPHGAAPAAGTSAPSPSAPTSSTSSTSSTSIDAGGGATTGPDAALHDPLVDDLLLDDVVEWDEPSVLVGATAATVAERERGRPGPALRAADWVDELGPDGVSDAPVRPALHARLPRVAVPPVEQFEVIWPSGETDDVTVPDEPGPHLDDRLRSAPLSAPHPAGVPQTNGRTSDDPTPDRGDESDASSDHTAPDSESDDANDVTPTADGTATSFPAPATPAERGTPGARDAEPTPDDALALRRAVASIDTGSLAVRRRLASPHTTGPTPPGRLIVGRELPTAWRTNERRPTGSVFDTQPANADEDDDVPEPAPSDQQRRQGALRRLIDSLRRDDRG